MSFEEYEKSLDGYIPHYKESYQDGAQSQQAKIDELQARVDKAMKHIESSDELSHKAYRDLVKILKGNKDEN